MFKQLLRKFISSSEVMYLTVDTLFPFTPEKKVWRGEVLNPRSQLAKWEIWESNLHRKTPFLTILTKGFPKQPVIQYPFLNCDSRYEFHSIPWPSTHVLCKRANQTGHEIIPVQRWRAFIHSVLSDFLNILLGATQLVSQSTGGWNLQFEKHFSTIHSH